MAWTTRRSSDRALVAGLTALAAAVFGWGFGRGGTHPYYTAAVRSMGANWHDFVYGAFDPSGFITTDKLPGAFWVQALSVRLFGFHTWSVLLPQVVAATACVPLLFVTIRRWAGRAAAYGAAVCYLLTPVTVALSRSNIPDALMVFFLVVAAHALWRWADGGRRAGWWLAASAAWLGVAFNVKMGQALLVVPAFAGACYLLGAGGRWLRLGRATAYGAVVATVSLAWMVFVTLTPAAGRPYIDGSVHNSVWEMVFQYNGFGRIGGQGAGTDPLAGGAVLSGAGGPAGLGRIFGAQSAGQISWLIPAAVVGLVGGLWAGWLGRTNQADQLSRLTSQNQTNQASQPTTPGQAGQFSQLTMPGQASQPGPPTMPGQAHQASQPTTPGQASQLSQPTTPSQANQPGQPNRPAQSPTHTTTGYLFWGAWLTIYALAFCTATGIHSYYTSTLAPPTAALAGAAFAAAARGRAWRLPVLVAGTAAWAFAASRETPHYQPWLRWVVVGAGVVAVATVVWARVTRGRVVGAVAGVAVLVAVLGAPAVWASSVLLRQGNSMGTVMAAAGPPQAMFGGRHVNRSLNDEIATGIRDFARGPDPRLISFLRHQRGARPYAAAVDGSMAAASFLGKGLSVLPMGGFTSDAPAPTVSGLAGLVHSGELRYVVITGFRIGRSGPAEAARDGWVTGHCRAVPGFGSGSKLFDCAQA